MGSMLKEDKEAQEKAEVFSAGDEPEKKVTEFKPFNITKPKPKMIPPPEQIKREVKAKPIPAGMFKKTLADVENEKAQRRKATTAAIQGDYEKDVKKKFELKTAALSSNKKVEAAKQREEARITKEIKP